MAVLGNQKLGHLSFAYVDVTMPVEGIPLQVIRTYDSRDLRPGDFGVGWRLSLNDVRIEKTRGVGHSWRQANNSMPTFPWIPEFCIEEAQPHLITVSLGPSRTLQFRPTFRVRENALGACSLSDLLTGWVTYEPVGGTRGRLEALDGSAGGAVLLVDDQLVHPVSLELHDPQLWLLTTTDGTQFRIQGRDPWAPPGASPACLQWVEDPVGNRVTVERDASGRPEGLVATPSGKSASFERDPVTHFITCVRDMGGHAFKYEQDLAGRLTHAWDRERAGLPCEAPDPLGWTSEYTYHGDTARIDEIRDPEGAPS